MSCHRGRVQLERSLKSCWRFQCTGFIQKFSGMWVVFSPGVDILNLDMLLQMRSYVDAQCFSRIYIFKPFEI